MYIKNPRIRKVLSTLVGFYIGFFIYGSGIIFIHFNLNSHFCNIFECSGHLFDHAHFSKSLLSNIRINNIFIALYCVGVQWPHFEWGLIVQIGVLLQVLGS